MDRALMYTPGASAMHRGAAASRRAPGLAPLVTKIQQLVSQPGTRSPWHDFARGEWPDLFALLDVCCGMLRLLQDRREGRLPAVWPTIDQTITDGLAIQSLIDWPAIVSEAWEANCREPADAAAELAEEGCTHIDCLVPADRRQALLRAIDRALEEDGPNIRVDLHRKKQEQAPELFDLLEEVLAGDVFRQITAYEFHPATYQVAVARQSLPARGLCWHRDLEWPVQPDVITVIYNLEDDSPSRGGAFLHYCAATNQIKYIFRQRHQATLLRNGEPRHRRPFHAVSEYHGPNTRRATLILQCVRAVPRPLPIFYNESATKRGNTMPNQHLRKLQEDKIQEIRVLEEELGVVLLAYEPKLHLATLTDAQAEHIQAAEKELSAVLLAYNPHSAYLDAGR